MGRVLVVYVQTQTPLRTSHADRLHAFRKYTKHDVAYLNALPPGAGWTLRFIRPDLLIVDTLLLDARFNPRVWPGIKRRTSFAERRECLKVMLPQDEYFDTDSLVGLARSLGIQLICSVAPKSEWSLLYGPATSNCRIERVLTGYVDEGTVRHVRALGYPEVRAIDIGYRAWSGEPYLGRQGQLKAEVGRRVGAVASTHEIATDIALQGQGQNLVGDDWWRWLLSCRWVLGVEGGASVLDRDGSLRNATRDFVKSHPGATFEEVEAACFPGRDGELDLRALSPRHLEACVTRTGQILIEGDYNGILRPWEHYLPLRRDFSNLDEILEMAKDESLRLQMVDRAHHDVIEAGVADYSVFTSTVLSQFEPLLPDERFSARVRAMLTLFGLWSSAWVWARSQVRSYLVLPIRRARASMIRVRRASRSS